MTTHRLSSLSCRPMSRRTVLAGMAAMGASTALAQSLPTNPDVIVIGAGAAGIQAARTLMANGKSVVVVEAADRIGGRIYTETTTFGAPFDHGASWINAADDNPFDDIARGFGLELLNHSDAGDALYVDGILANSLQRADNNRAWGAVEQALYEAGEAGLDVAASSVIPGDIPFSGVVQTWIGAMDYGVDFKHLSTLDYWNGAPATPSFLVREGLGHTLALYGADLPVKLNCRATRIDTSGKGVRVDTCDGTLAAQAVIVTVSTGVLNAGSIQFTPDLPVATQEAIGNLPMGLLNKVALQFDKTRLGFIANNWLTHWVPNEMPAEAAYFLTWPFGFDYMVGFIGGEFGWELSAAGEAAAVDFALGQIVKIAGSDAQKAFVKGALTGWADDPNTIGSYAAARPGHYSARSALAVPVTDRLHFAGEALGGPYAATCNGAYKSGEVTARAVLASLTD